MSATARVCVNSSKWRRKFPEKKCQRNWTTARSHTASRFSGAFFASSNRVWNHAYSGSVGTGDAKAAEELLPLVYDELRRLAAGRMANEIAGHTLQPTALVHEAWLRLGGDEAPSFQNRAHFFGAAAEAMRRILIERARRRVAAKRGAGAAMMDVDEIEIPSPVADDDQLLAVNDAVENLPPSIRAKPSW